MSTPVTYVTIPASAEIAQQLPADLSTRAHVLELGVRQWRIEQALEDYRHGLGSLAFAAEQAGVSVREMIIYAFAYGLPPQIDPAWLSASLTLAQAQTL